METGFPQVSCSFSSSVVHPAVFLVFSWLIHVHLWTSAHLKPWTAQDVITLCSSRSCLTDPNLLYCGNPGKWCPVFHFLTVSLPHTQPSSPLSSSSSSSSSSRLPHSRRLRSWWRHECQSIRMVLNAAAPRRWWLARRTQAYGHRRRSAQGGRVSLRRERGHRRARARARARGGGGEEGGGERRVWEGGEGFLERTAN